MGSLHIDRLKYQVRTEPSSASPETQALLQRAHSEIHERAKSASEPAYFVSAMRTIGSIRGTVHAELRLECLRECSTILYANGLTKEALESAMSLQSLAKASANRRWERISDTILGIVFADAGDLTQAIFHYSRAIEEADELGDLDGEIITYLNLGTALNYGGLYRQAVLCFLKSARLCSPANSHHLTLKASALCNVAQSYKHLGEFEAGFEAIKESLALSEEPQSAYECYNRTVREQTFVQLALEMGHVDLAVAAADRCSGYAHRSGSERAIHLAKLGHALTAVGQGRISAGAKMIEALMSSKIASISVFRVDTLIALVKVYDKLARVNEALDCVRQLVAHISSERMKGLQALCETVPQISSELPVTSRADLQWFSNKELEFRARAAERKAEQSEIEVLDRLAISAGLREDESGGHGYRVGALVRLLGLSLKYSEDEVRNLEIAGRLHDIGKLRIPDRILLSQETLAQADRQLVCAHALVGAELLSRGDTSQLRLAEMVARSHHERWDGSGYPDGLRGDQIPLAARIVAVVDFFDATTHGRPYAPPWPIELAIGAIRDRAGIHFDPDIAKEFCDMVVLLASSHEDLDQFLVGLATSKPFFLARARIESLLEDD